MFFVTGGTGLVGSFIVRKLLSEKHKVRCLLRSASNLRMLEDIKDEIEFVEGNILDVTSLEKHLNGIHTIIHAAALVSFAGNDVDDLYTVNVEGTRNIVNAALFQNIQSLIFISSVASLGKNKSSISINERAIWENSYYNTHYAKSKYLSELEVWRGKEEGLDVLIINPSVVLGPGDWNKGSSQLFKYVYNEKPFFPTGNINYIDVRDVAEIAFKLYDLKAFNERYIVNGGNTSFKEFFDCIAKKMGKKTPTIKVNPWLAELAWRFVYLLNIFSGKQPFLTKETARNSKKKDIYETKKIDNLLNIKYKGLDKTVDWIVDTFNHTLL